MNYINTNINLLTINNNIIINGSTYGEMKKDNIQYIDIFITNYNNKLINHFKDN